MIDKEDIPVDNESVLKALLIIQKRCKQTPACEMCFAWDEAEADCRISYCPSGFNYIRAMKNLKTDIAEEESNAEVHRC